MARIVAGHFQLRQQIERTRRVLADAGVAAGRISAFYVNQPGQHDLHALGAHVGSLYSLHGMKESGEPEPGGGNRDAPRHAGMLLEVALEDDAQEARALALPRGLGAEYLERADGDIVDGDWRDFDPLAAPRLLPRGAPGGAPGHRTICRPAWYFPFRSLLQ